MPQPSAYSPTTDFSDDELANAGGRSTVRTAALDGELAGIATSIGGIRTNLALNQRDDGEIRDERVKLHTLASDVRALLAAGQGLPRGAWLTATAYALRDVVTQGGNTYICAVAHTSGTFATDLAATKWLLMALGTATAAASIPFTPSATLAATNVQAAVEEADTENRALLSALSADLANTATTARGDALVGVKSTLTGATERTQHAKNADSVSVEDFCNGVTAADGVDFSAYIQAAVDSGARCVEFTQSGVYYFADVTIPAGVTVSGRGVAQIKLKPFSGTIGGGFHGFFKGNNAAGITVTGFVCDGNASSQAADASNVDRYAGFYFVDCDDLAIVGNRFTSEPYGNASIRVRQGSRVQLLRNTMVNRGIYYNAYSGSQYSVTIDGNETTGCGLSINDDGVTQHLYGWSISNNRVRASNALDEVGIGARASNGVITGNTILGGYFGMTISAGGATFQQHDVLVTGNTVAADSGNYNPYGIEHFAYDITISDNVLTNCGIVSSSATGRNVKIRNNLLTAPLSASATDAAIALSSGAFTNVDISGNTIKSHGTGIVLSVVTAGLVVADNIIDLTDYTGASTGIKLENATASNVTLTGAVIRGNIVKNASKAWLFATGNGSNTLTLADFRAVFNPTTGTSAALNLAASASLASDSMHSFNEAVYPTFQNVPTSATGLPSGAVWRDAADSNRLKMVP